ncbi:MAG TPA: folylpolyglutamate synthase/dihydrofolate synthase family protein [Pirellulaceae bacterium]|jgi:dihydrofolate synthase/folylpolyglutamate synthase|nr:folylpolyglutamate synthase/dihydrofolate synthase family protein [Pirellulaceae bacterium]
MPSVSATIQDYAQALEYLHRRIDYEKIPISLSSSSEFRLDRMTALLAPLGDPHTRWPAVHVAGTKGKGSTATMIAAILTAAGLRTGLYTSPHLLKLEERFAVDGQPCTAEDVIDLARRTAAAEEVARDADGSPLQATFFEATTAMAIAHFADRQVDVAALEVGLGGRLDSTNVCQPAVCVISSIGFDHMKQLGYDLGSIAREKAGILKPGVPAVVGVTDPEPLSAIRDVAAQRRAELLAVEQDFGLVDREEAGAFDYFDRFEGEEFRLERLIVHLPGAHQKRNGALAVAAVRQLCRSFPGIGEAAIREGLASAFCRARIERACEKPLTYVDSAHTVESLAALLETLETELRARPLVTIFGVSRDKPWRAMLDLLAPRCRTLILTKYVENPRAAEPEEMADYLASDEFPGGSATPPIVARTPAEAWEKYLAATDERTLGCVVGSFFLAAETLPLIDATCRKT